VVRELLTVYPVIVVLLNSPRTLVRSSSLITLALRGEVPAGAVMGAVLTMVIPKMNGIPVGRGWGGWHHPTRSGVV
jgi:hypothetical protein